MQESPLSSSCSSGSTHLVFGGVTPPCVPWKMEETWTVPLSLGGFAASHSLLHLLNHDRLWFGVLSLVGMMLILLLVNPTHDI